MVLVVPWILVPALLVVLVGALVIALIIGLAPFFAL
jgi:hypothetical protein